MYQKNRDTDQITGERAATTGRDFTVDIIALFAVLFTLYLLTFNGRFTSIDELAIYARTESLVQQGEFDRPQVAFAEYHNPVGEQEVGYSVVATPFYWLAQQAERFNNIHLVMLLNPLLTALTAAALYATTRVLGYSRRGSLLGALAFGMTTLAWPYARTLYREPLVALGWSLGLLGLVWWRERQRVGGADGGSHRGLLLGGAALVLTLPVKVTAIAALPFIFLAALTRVRRGRQLRRLVVRLLLAGAILALLFYVIFSWRYGSLAYLDVFARWTPRIGLKRVYGLLLSPGKGLLFYMPVVVPAVYGLLLLLRRHGAVALAAGLPLLTTAVAYSSYESWFGGQSWGPRFLVPAIPLLMVGMAPLWDRARRRWQRALLLAVIGFSLVVQLGVVSADWWPAYRPLLETGPRPEANAGLAPGNLALSPPLVQLQVWDPGNLDLLWLHPNVEGEPVFTAGLALALALAPLLAGGGWWLAGRKEGPAALPLLAPALALGALLWWGNTAAPGYPGLRAETGRNLAATVAGDADGAYTLVTVSNEFHIYHYLGYLKGEFVHHWLSPRQADEFAPILEETAGRRLTLVVDRVHLQPAYSGKELERWLNRQLFRSGSRWTAGYEVVDYGLLPEGDWPWQATDVQFGESFSLDGYAIGAAQVRPGQILGLQLRLCRTGPVPEDYRLFSHLQAGANQISGQDGPVRYRPAQPFAATWEVGDCLVEKRGIAIPAGAQPGRYELIVGFSTADGPLPVGGEAGGEAAPAYVTLATVEVVGPASAP